MMCGMDSLRILIPFHSAHDGGLVEKSYSNNGHAKHPKLEGDENNV